MNLSNLHLSDDHLGDIIQRLNTLPRPFQSLPLLPVTAHISSRFHNSATPIQGNSYMVSQGCYGISQHEPLGTQHVGNCVALVLRNPQSNLTALIHFDARTSPDSLDYIFQQFEGQPVEAAILGAKYAIEKHPDYGDDGQEYVQQTSRQNLLNILRVLESKQIPLTAAWVADIAQPHAFIIDPKSGQMEINTPSLPDPEQNILFATRYFSGGLEDIALAYDLTQSSERQKMPLNPETTAFFDKLAIVHATKTPKETEEWMVSIERHPADLPFFMSMLAHYQKTHSPIKVGADGHNGQDTTTQSNPYSNLDYT